MVYVGLDRQKRYTLIEPPIASGGEGKIFTIAGAPDRLAKVYHLPERVEQDKLRFMVMETQGEYGKLINKAIAWPLDGLMDATGRVYGFIMTKFPGVTKLSEILPDKSIDWGKRVVIAWNLCEIVQDVEKMNQCIGDMNPSNFGVDLSSGGVYAFDVDSFHFRAGNGRLYPCHVGIAEYYAPELQRQITRGQDMRTLDPEQTFTRQTDRFALAVLIFQLLFSGYHPFSARRLEQYGSSTVVHRQSTNILNKVCAYFNPAPGTGIPVDAPPISIIPQEMQQMFRRAFLTEDRPSATEWQGALSDLLRRLKQCGRQHYYYSGLSKCPWCQMLESRTDVNVKPGVRSDQGSKTKPDPPPKETVNPAPVSQKKPITGEKNGCLKFFLFIIIIGVAIGFWGYYNEEPKKPSRPSLVDTRDFIQYVDSSIQSANPTGRESSVSGVWEYHRYIRSSPLGKKEIVDEIDIGFDESTYDVTWISETLQMPYWTEVTSATRAKMEQVYSEWQEKYSGLKNSYDFSMASFDDSGDRYSITFHGVDDAVGLRALSSAGFLDCNGSALNVYDYCKYLEKEGYKEGGYNE